MASERLQAEKQFHSNNHLLEMSRSPSKMRLKSAPQKLNILMAEAISKSYIVAAYTLARSRIVTHSKTASLSIKTILFENTNNLFSKKY